MSESPRTRAQRRADVIAQLEGHEADAWVATASPAGVAHLVPLSFSWDGWVIVLAVEASSPTVRNVTATRRARLGIGPTRDVAIIDVELAAVVAVAGAPTALADQYATQTAWDPRLERGDYVFLSLRPRRIQAWREADELRDRLLMQDGDWLS